MLPCCDGLCHTSAWVSRRYTHVTCLLDPFPLPSHPRWRSQRTGSGPLCMFPWLSAYGDVSVSGLLSQTVPPSLSPTVSKVWSVCLHLQERQQCFFLVLFVYGWAESSLLCVGLSLAVSGGYSLVEEPGFWGARASVVVEHGFCGSTARGISMYQGLNACFLHWQVGF